MPRIIVRNQYAQGPRMEVIERGYRLVKQLTCLNLDTGKDHLCNIFQHTDTRWYFDKHACTPKGYATLDQAKDAAIAAHKAGTLDIKPVHVVVTPSGLQSLLPGVEPAPVVTGEASQQRMF